MRKVIALFLLLSLAGCKSEDKIEIYLLKNRAPIKDGVPYLDVFNIQDAEKRKEYEFVNYDTVFKETIYAGKFEAKSTDLQSQPFIGDDEIISFNTGNNKFEFSSSVAERLETLPDEMHEGIQFVITVNKKPQLTGYFRNWSVWCDWYYIRYWNYKKGEGEEIKNKNSFELFNGYMRGKHEDLTPPYPQELIEAFRSTGRLIE